jgi:3-oxoacyl-[acyl-carrier protein] reductase
MVQSSELGLRGKRALVTGASRGLGRAVAMALAEAGADVAVHCHRQLMGAEGVARAVRDRRCRSLVLPADLADHDQVAHLARELLDAWGPPDLIVNNAGIAPRSPWSAGDLAAWRHALDVNLTGPFHVLTAFVPHLQPGAAVVNIGSVVALNGGAFGPAYGASKAGLLGLTKSAARELGPRSIRVNCVAPGPIDSDLARALPEAALQAMAAQTPLGRIATYDDVVGAILWLLSPAARFVTGQTLVVDGGRLTP